MGCFAFTCGLSGLPIAAGDPVRYILLAENPYDDELVCSSHDLWFPRSLPIRAHYNDYGSIENYDSDSPGIKAIERALQEDLVEVGTGNNRAHDIPTYKEMSFDQVLEAVCERRILVSSDTSQRDADEDKLHKNIPTLQRLRTLLPELGFKVENQEGSFLVNERARGWCRIREGGYGGTNSALDRLLEKLKPHYAVLMTAGSGNYSDRKEIQVMPQPVDEREHLSFLSNGRKKPLAVYQLMILEDVWDVVKNFFDYKKHRKDIQEKWNAAMDRYSIDTTKLDPELAEMLRSIRMDTWSRIPFTIGPSHHLSYAAEIHAQQPFTEQQIDEFLEDAAIFQCLERLIPEIRYWWKPSFSCGPQCAEYETYCDWFEALMLISKKRNSDS